MIVKGSLCIAKSTPLFILSSQIIRLGYLLKSAFDMVPCILMTFLKANIIELVTTRKF